MTEHIPEHDWKYMRSVQDQMLNVLAASANRRSAQILSGDIPAELEKFRMLYKHIEDTDRIIADCFNDWRRSTLLLRLFALHRNGLLTEEHMKNLSEETRKVLHAVEEASKR